MEGSPLVTRSPATLRLIDAARAGDEDAYSRLFAATYARARLFTRARLGPKLAARVDVDDVLQEAYLQAHKSFASFEYRGDGSFLRWLCRVIENRIRNLSEHHGAKRRTPSKGWARVSAFRSRLAAEDPLGLATKVVMRESSARLIEAIDALDDDERTVLLHRFFQGRSLREIEAETGIAASTARRVLARALVKVGDALEAA